MHWFQLHSIKVFAEVPVLIQEITFNGITFFNVTIIITNVQKTLWLVDALCIGLLTLPWCGTLVQIIPPLSLDSMKDFGNIGSFNIILTFVFHTYTSVAHSTFKNICFYSISSHWIVWSIVRLKITFFSIYHSITTNCYVVQFNESYINIYYLLNNFFFFFFWLFVICYSW